ncbi:MAG: UDP-2,3-diacylglucosamine diphosphatase [Bacteroidia bacterium]
MMHDSPTKIYLLSDLHLGAPDPARSLLREKHAVRFLREVAHDASHLYLLGDVFDFWFEYKRAVPRGYVRLLGQLAEMADRGVEIHVFAGNHDLWYRDYLHEQFGAILHHDPVEVAFFGRRYFLAHGDGLGPGDHGYKLMKRVFTHPLSKWLYARLHPNFGIALAQWLSQHGGNHSYGDGLPPEEQHKGHAEYLYAFARDMHRQRPDIDCYVFGHRHVLIDDTLADGPQLVILGDWIQYFSYLAIDEAGSQLTVFPLQVSQPQP